MRDTSVMRRAATCGLATIRHLGCSARGGGTATRSGDTEPAAATSTTNGTTATTPSDASDAEATSSSATTRADTTSAPGTSDGDATTGGPACAGFDPNGVAQIYCTREGKALPWTLGFDDWQDRIRQFGDITGEGALTEVEASGQVRMTVLAVPGDCEGIEDHGVALAQGFMCSADDWLDWEITGYFQLVTPADAQTDQDWVLYGNGGRHTGDGTTL